MPSVRFAWPGGHPGGLIPYIMTATLVGQFKAKFEDLRGHVHLVKTWEEAARAAAAVCRDAAPECVALAPLPEAMRKAFHRNCEDAPYTVIGPPYAADALPEAIGAAQIGVSSAEFAVAATGTLVEVTTDDAYRLVSSLPRVHICVFSARDLVGNLHDASPRLRAILQSHEGDCTVSFISGPSRTGDIEMILTLGVHGPEEAHAIVLLDGGELEAGHV